MGDPETSGGATAEDATHAADLAKAVAEAPSRAEAIVRDWFDRRVRNSPVSMCVDAYNHMQTAIEDLVSALKEG